MDEFEKITEILQDLCGKEKIRPEDALQEDLSLDSLNMVMLLLELEDTFEITLDESDMNPFELSTVQDTVDLVHKYCGDRRDPE